MQYSIEHPWADGYLTKPALLETTQEVISDKGIGGVKTNGVYDPQAILPDWDIDNPIRCGIRVNQYFTRGHWGLDLSPCDGNLDILAVKDGTVEYVGNEPDGYGLYAIVAHEDGFRTLYAHMSRILAIQGKSVQQGAILGIMGSTGRSTGTHLHWEIWYNGYKINGLRYLTIE